MALGMLPLRLLFLSFFYFLSLSLSFFILCLFIYIYINIYMYTYACLEIMQHSRKDRAFNTGLSARTGSLHTNLKHENNDATTSALKPAFSQVSR